MKSWNSNVWFDQTSYNSCLTVMYKIWLVILDWNYCETGDILFEEKIFFNSIEQFAKLKISQVLFFFFLKIELYDFCNPRKKRFRCMYVRDIHRDYSAFCILLKTRNRVAPLNSLSPPRLELCGTFLLSNLSKQIVNIFANKWNFDSVNL